MFVGWEIHLNTRSFEKTFGVIRNCGTRAAELALVHEEKGGPHTHTHNLKNAPEAIVSIVVALSISKRHMR